MRFLTLAFLLALAPALPCLAQSTTTHTLEEDLIYRINFGSADDVHVLLEKGANPNVKSNQGEPALDMAMERNDAETVKMALDMIKHGADVEEVDKSGNTPIMNAIHFQQAAIVKMLLAKGADYNAKTPDGLPLIEYAHRFGDLDSANAIQAMLDKDAAFEASLRTPERFKEIVHKYTVGSCQYQYWSYFYTSRQDPARDDEMKKKVETIRKSLTGYVTQIEKYYTSSSTEALKKVSDAAVNDIFKELDSMVSNRNRMDVGIGKQEDADTRCEKVVDDLHINFVGTLRNGGESAPTDTSAPAPSEGAPRRAAPPLPLDPGAAR